MPNVEKFAKALYALHLVECLNDYSCRKAVGEFIRGATEEPHWHVNADYLSKSAAAELLAHGPFKSAAQYQQFCKKKLAHEHVVAVSVIRKIFCQETDISEVFIAKTLRNLGLRATITRRENQKLNDAGLMTRMPEEFWDSKSKLYMDPLARYIKIGMDKNLTARPVGGWFAA